MSKEFFKVKKGINLDPISSSSVSSPEVGDIIVDSSDNNKLKRYDGVTASWKDVGSGVGGINYISTNSDFEGGTTGYAIYANTVASVSPETGTGGSPNPSFTFTATTSSPLRGTKSGLITKDAASRQGHGVSYDFDIDSADQAQVLRISFDYNTSVDYADGDIRLYVYDVFNSRLIEVVDRDLYASSFGKFVGTFQTSPDSTSYRLIFHVASANALTYTVEIDNVIVGPQTIVKGAIVTDWQAYSPSDSSYAWGTVSSSNFKYRRNADSIDIDISFQLSSGLSTAFELSQLEYLPPGLSVDTNKKSGGVWGIARAVDVSAGSTANDFCGIVINSHATDVGGLRIVDPNDDIFDNTAPFSWSSGDILQITLNSIPIQGWSSNVVLSEDVGNREIVARYNIASTAIANTGTTIINFSNKQYDTSASVTTGASWSFSCPESGYYDVGAKIRFIDSAAFTAGTRAALYVFVNGVQTVTLAFHEVESSDAASFFMSVNGNSLLYLSKGDSVNFRAAQTTATASIALDGGTTENYVSIAKRSSPQTIAASEVVAMRATNTSGFSIPTSTSTIINYDIIEDTHGSLNASTGIYTIPVSGFYIVNAKFLTLGFTPTSDTNLIELRVQKNGSSVAFSGTRTATTTFTSFYVSINTINFFNKGDLINVNISSTVSVLMSSSAVGNEFSIVKVNGVS